MCGAPGAATSPCARNPMGRKVKMADLSLVAAILTAGQLARGARAPRRAGSKEGDEFPYAAKLFFDQLDALEAERDERLGPLAME